MTHRVCRSCGESKALNFFKKEKRNANGYSSLCKACAVASTTAYRNANLEKRMKYEEEYRSHNRDLLREKYYSNIDWHREYYKRNVEKYAENGRRYCEVARPKKAAHAAKRRAAVRQRSIGLTDEHVKQIEWFYEEAHRLTSETGVTHHVDHIVPLQGKEMSGLHAPWNLQVIPAKENLSKFTKVNFIAALPVAVQGKINT